MRTIFWVLAGTAAGGRCRFATNYTSNELVTDAARLESFTREFLEMEAKFVRQAGVHMPSQMTRSGWHLDENTGGLGRNEDTHFTTPAVESLHLAIIIKALIGDEYGKLFYNTTEAIDVLTKKISTIEKFNTQFPGYGSFLPAAVNYLADGSIIPDNNSWGVVRGVDNGAQIWSIWTLVKVLRENFPNHADLATRWDSLLSSMLGNAKLMFLETEGARAGLLRVQTLLMKADGSAADGRSPMADLLYKQVPGCVDDVNACVKGDGCYLNNPYEGELLTVALDLLDAGLSEEEKTKMWSMKKCMLEKSQFITTDGKTFDVQKGLFSSSREQWKYLVLPYRNSAVNWATFVNTEKARTWHAVSMDDCKCGMSSSIIQPLVKDQYWGNANFVPCGMPPPMSHFDGPTTSVTPFAAFPLLLASQPHGAAWVNNMLGARRMQNCYGMSEGVWKDGFSTSARVNWETKITTALAFMGGIVDVTESHLQSAGLLEKFVSRIETEWASVFSAQPLGAVEDFKLPTNPIPDNVELVEWEGRCTTDQCAYPYPLENTPIEVIQRAAGHRIVAVGSAVIAFALVFVL